MSRIHRFFETRMTVDEFCWEMLMCNCLGINGNLDRTRLKKEILEYFKMEESTLVELTEKELRECTQEIVSRMK